MKARQLIDGASYGPDALKVIVKAFDEAWVMIAGNYDSASVEAARHQAGQGRPVSGPRRQPRRGSAEAGCPGGIAHSLPRAAFAG
jgi:hypothetical protein